MGWRNEQCRKICRIIDNFLANRPTERDSLIVAVRKAFDVLEQAETNCSEFPNNSDTISRQQTIDALRKMQTYKLFAGDDMILVDKAQVQTELMMLPSVQPERPRGHWVEIGDEPYDEWECDVCGFVIDGSGCIDPEEYRDVYKFCPNCGADMRGEQE